MPLIVPFGAGLMLRPSEYKRMASLVLLVVVLNPVLVC